MEGNIKRIFIYLSMVFLSLSLWGWEFIHVFTSKGIYETCEDLWFKCVAFDDSTMHVSDRSHTAYVEILDSSDSVVWREKYRMSGGMCDGHAYIGDDWQPGEYRMFVQAAYVSLANPITGLLKLRAYRRGFCQYHLSGRLYHTETLPRISISPAVSFSESKKLYQKRYKQN